MPLLIACSLSYAVAAHQSKLLKLFEEQQEKERQEEGDREDADEQEDERRQETEEKGRTEEVS